ncbi:hypothetical protein PV553_003660, partial [Vibrio cholerae]|nr:hypothetical protein [Vibrio cholerae]
GFNISEDFIKLRTKDKINNFIKEKIVKPAVEVGIVDRKFQESKYIDELRQRLLKSLNQDHYFEYGSEKNLQLSLVMMFSDLYSQPILSYGKTIPAYSDSFFSDLWESMLSGFINSIEPVKLYEHESYHGHSISLNMDSEFLHGFNDIASSIKIPKGWQVTLFEHGGYTGSSIVANSDIKALGEKNLNDTVSSLMVEYVGDDPSELYDMLLLTINYGNLSGIDFS